MFWLTLRERQGDLPPPFLSNPPTPCPTSPPSNGMVREKGGVSSNSWKNIKPISKNLMTLLLSSASTHSACSEDANDCGDGEPSNSPNQQQSRKDYTGVLTTLGIPLPRNDMWLTEVKADVQ